MDFKNYERSERIPRFKFSTNWFWYFCEWWGNSPICQFPGRRVPSTSVFERNAKNIFKLFYGYVRKYWIIVNFDFCKNVVIDMWRIIFKLVLVVSRQMMNSGCNVFLLHMSSEFMKYAVWAFPITVLYCVVLYCIVLYCIVLYCTVLCCSSLYCTVLYCAVLKCTVLYCAVQ